MIKVVIQQIALDHSGGFYQYRVHQLKIKNLCNGFDGLTKFLDKMFVACPDEHFQGGPRSSSLKFNLGYDLIEVRGHEVSRLAEHGLQENGDRFKTAHSKVQLFMLENDNATIAMEVPIWLEAEELEDYEKLFGTTETLSGHIDVLRIEDGKIWVWDYKPKAKKEKFAATQVHFYAYMLSKRTNIPFEEFRCGYFDDTHTYIFKPKLKKFAYNKELVNF